jgi:deoxyribose-phosphate aldolase
VTVLPANSQSVAALIDHTLLKPEATRMDVERLCKEAVEHQFAAVCVNPVFLLLVKKLLHGSKVKNCTVIGFPLGANSSETKVEETRLALAAGAEEIDMVIHVGGLKAGDNEAVAKDILGVVQAAHGGGAICKVIIETCLLTEEEKERACRIALDAGADFVKTSTGFSTGGATVADVALMRRVVGPKMGVKASGGVRTLDDLMKMVQAGATRIGSSSGVKIMAEARAKFSK